MTSTVTIDHRKWSPQELRAQVREAQRHPVIPHFHAHWYHQPITWGMTNYKGVPMMKNPLDLQIYHEIIWAWRPTVIIETGTCFGGSALWFADQLDMLPDGDTSQVVSIDVEPQGELTTHPHVTYLKGSSTDATIVDQCRSVAAPDLERVMVVLDSDHHQAHVAKELELYAPMVSRHQYLVVEDTNLSQRPLWCEDDPGPGAAVDLFLETNHGQFFRAEEMCERYLLTVSPGGWLQRVG